MFSIRIRHYLENISRLSAVLVVLFLTVASTQASGDLPVKEAAKFLPEQLAALKAKGPATQPVNGIGKRAPLSDFGVTSNASRVYDSQSGGSFNIEVVRLENE